ncbi:MAG TPA: alkaline phosphatase family protein [Ktedonobacteraceae bacterium]|jgi:predicted AlkP superfamily phosphohydrolase/phosphomutase
MAQPKVVVIGLDSITPAMVEHFLAQGRMPHLQRLREQGWSAEVTPTMPPTTPAGWTTIASGAWPSTHGIEGFTVHIGGEPLDKKRYACSSAQVRAERIWQTAERAGKRTILLKYPVSWPPDAGAHVLQVDGAGGWGGLKCVWDLAHSACWDTAATSANAPGAPQEQWLTRDPDNLDEEQVHPLPVQPAGNWPHLPQGVEPLWETWLELQAATDGAQAVGLYLLAVRVGEACRLGIAQTREERDPVFLARGQWSPWHRVSLATAEGPRSGNLRFKVMDFDAPARRLRLYQTQIHQDRGYTRPQAVADELLSAVGPFVEWTESYDRLQGWIDDETQLEIYAQHVDWMSRAACHLLAQHPWDLFMTQVHFVDMAYHMYWGAVHPQHPQYDAARAPAYWELLGRVHELADQFVGNVLAALDPQTLVIVLGDHGHDLYHTCLLVNHLLLQEGLLTLVRDPRTGRSRIDWRRTQAYANGYRVFLNVAGRDPQGCVDPGSYDALQERVIQMLSHVCDPRTGQHPVRMALRLADAEALGLYGESMGDIVFAMAPGYQARTSVHIPAAAWQGQRLQQRQIATLKQTRLFAEFSGEHDTSFPLTRAMRTLLFASGPGVRVGRAQVPVRLVDVAPTICDYLGIPFPRECEGNSFAHSLRA